MSRTNSKRFRRMNSTDSSIVDVDEMIDSNHGSNNGAHHHRRDPSPGTTRTNANNTKGAAAKGVAIMDTVVDTSHRDSFVRNNDDTNGATNHVHPFSHSGEDEEMQVSVDFGDDVDIDIGGGGGCEDDEIDLGGGISYDDEGEIVVGGEDADIDLGDDVKDVNIDLIAGGDAAEIMGTVLGEDMSQGRANEEAALLVSKRQQPEKGRSVRMSEGRAVGFSEENQTLIPENHRGEEAISHVDPELDYGYNEYGSEEMGGESGKSLRKRLSIMERLQKSLIAPDERKEKLLPQDTFSYLIISETWGFPFVASLIIFCLQVTTFILVILDLAAQGDKNNVFGVPANVSAQLRTTQFIAVLVAVLTQGDLRTAFTLLRDGFTKDFDASFNYTSHLKYRLSVACRAVSGSIGLMVSFVLIVTAPSVVELLLNFTAIEFVSSIDELCFYLSKQGFLGSRCKNDAMIISTIMYKVAPESRMGWFRRTWKTVSLFFIFGIFLIGWVAIVLFQLSGKYLCNTVMVQFGDGFVASLGTFNGVYDMQDTGMYVPFVERRVQYAERRSFEIVSPVKRGMFGYCDDLDAWTFRLEAVDGSSGTDPCDWLARSSATDTFDITETAGEPWLVRDSTLREVILDPFFLYCFDCENEGEENSDDCGGSGSCRNAICKCDEGFYGLRCEFSTPCSQLSIDARTDEFASTRDWSADYQTISLQSGSLVEAYNRPVYFHQYASGEYDVVMFTGRRWALTSSEFLPQGGKLSDEELGAMMDEDRESVGNDIGNFFKYVYHGYRGNSEDYSVAFLSDYMDATTERDASTPVGFQWFRAEQRKSGDENQAPAREVDTVFLCRTCDLNSNACLYDGVCVDGACQCSLDSFGVLCEIPPVGNGHCDPFFNTPEFKMDGGDCCEQTCVSSDQYVCGAEEQGYVSTGYFACGLPKGQWQDDPINGGAGSFSGFSLDLSIRSLAVGELLQDRVQIYDKVGSSWTLRDTLQGDPNSRFGTMVALSSGPYNVVTNPSFLAPLTLAIADGFRTLRIYKCGLEGCELSQEIPAVFDFVLSDDGSVLATKLLSAANVLPTTIRVYESVQGVFQTRTDLNVTKDGALLNLYSMALSGDGGSLVVHSQTVENTESFTIVKADFFDVTVWNGVSYEFETEFKIDNADAGFNTYRYPLSLALSQDGKVLAFGIPECDFFQLNVYSRDAENKWVPRPSPPVDSTGCIASDRPLRNNNLDFSMDGSMMAFRLGTQVEAFQWTSSEWRRVGAGFPLTNYPLSMSSDGKELSVGSPEDGIGGITNVYSLPGRKVCADNTSLLRVSITLDRLPGDITWDLKNNQTGEMLYQQGPYPEDYAYGTIVEETCVENEFCYEFGIYNKNRNVGLQAPGQYALFMDGTDIGRGTFSGLYEKVSFGNCASCPEGTEPFSLLMLTCGPMSWGLQQMIDQGASATLLETGTSIGVSTDETVYSSCDEQKGLCGNPVELAYRTCLDPSECYAVVVNSPNRQIAYLELDLGEKKASGDTTKVCSGTATFIGNPDMCSP